MGTAPGTHVARYVATLRANEREDTDAMLVLFYLHQPGTSQPTPPPRTCSATRSRPSYSCDGPRQNRSSCSNRRDRPPTALAQLQAPGGCPAPARSGRRLPPAGDRRDRPEGPSRTLSDTAGS